MRVVDVCFLGISLSALLLLVSCENDNSFKLRITANPLSTTRLEFTVENIGEGPAYLTSCTENSFVWRVEKNQSSDWMLFDGSTCLAAYGGQVYLLDAEEIFRDTLDIGLKYDRGIYRMEIPVSGILEGDPISIYSDPFEISDL